MAVATRRRFELRLRDLANLLIYVGLLTIGILELPSSIWEPEARKVVIVLGIIGVWRYTWWFTHWVRAQIYSRLWFPPRRDAAEAVWRSGWRPDRVFFMVVTYKERRETTDRMLDSIFRQTVAVGIPATVFVGTAGSYDEGVIARWCEARIRGQPMEVITVRQNRMGKRMAIALVLRAISRYGVGPDDPVVFMDGDSILAPDCLRQTLPIFQIEPRVHALTTDEQAIVYGPRWMQTWLDMRFAQRHIAMRSHALSRRVITLTGRMSVFRARVVVDEAFIRLVEADHLEHWLWGDFRFLSGDDKSTWFHLLSQGAEMLYIPDALVYTVDEVAGSPWRRMAQNLLRWSGNMLRNGWRAIQLGPRRMPLFIWWCLVDQRIAMWTMLISPTATLAAATLLTPAFLLAGLLWVAFTRLVLALFMYPTIGRLDVATPFVLYANQLVSAVMKVYTIFRLPKQRWSHRGDQRLGPALQGWSGKRLMAAYLTFLYVLLLVFATLTYTGILRVPGWLEFRLLFGLS